VLSDPAYIDHRCRCPQGSFDSAQRVSPPDRAEGDYRGSARVPKDAVYEMAMAQEEAKVDVQQDQTSAVGFE